MKTGPEVPEVIKGFCTQKIQWIPVKNITLYHSKDLSSPSDCVVPFVAKEIFWASPLGVRFPCSVCEDAYMTKSFNNHHKAIHEAQYLLVCFLTMSAALSLTQPHTWSPAMFSEPCGHEGQGAPIISIIDLETSPSEIMLSPYIQ